MSSETEQNRELQKRLRIALLTPVALLVAVGALLGLQLVRMTGDAHWVEHSDEALSMAHTLQKDIVDQETGLRGFLLTDDRLYLEPYESSHPGHTITTLHAFVSDNPGQMARVDAIQKTYEAWSDDTSSLSRGVPSADLRTPASMRLRKRRMDEVRASLQSFIDEETSLRKTRAQKSESSATWTKWIFIGLFLTAGAGLSFLSRRQLEAIASIFGAALKEQHAARVALEAQEWIRTGLIVIAEKIQGDMTLDQLGDSVLTALVPYVKADIAAIFTTDGATWKRRAGFALDSRAVGQDTFGKREGLVGRAASGTAIVHLKEVPADFMKVRSGTGERLPVEIVLAPAITEKDVRAVVELGFLRPVEPRCLELIERLGESIALAVRSAEYKEKLRELLEESQRQAEELQTQQEELRVANEELEEQSKQLEEGQSQLEEINTRLEEKAHELEGTQRAVIDKAAQVEQASRYKSEFLANMSHELRTPLNSSLILSKLLADNRDGNLTAEQIKFAETIYSAGNDLLTLINDVLDLSKIEAGKVDVNTENVVVSRITDAMKRTFEPIARDKALRFEILVDDGAPSAIDTDPQRVEQILRNLLSNAFKFVERGEVSLRVTGSGERIQFAVRDTGIGIPKEQQGLIFEAFRQADGTTNRKYGGTGLGLSISRDLARLLGGELEVESIPGVGSTFTLSIPWKRAIVPARAASMPPPRYPAAPMSVDPRARAHAAKIASTATIADDRATIDARRRTVLVVEDDVTFAQIVFDLAHELDFQCVVAHDADTGVALAAEHLPSAVILDLNLPDHSGLSVLDRMKRNPATRHIPVHVVSAMDYTQAALSMGAIGVAKKPIKREELVAAFRKLEERFTRRLRRLLIVEDDAVQRDSLCLLLGGSDVETIAVGTVKEALAALGTSSFDCVVTDLTLPDASGFDLLDRMDADEAYVFPPVIVYTGRSLTAAEEQRLRKHSSSIIVKGARSPERLLDEVSLFLHRVESELPPERQRMLKQARDREAFFDGRRILVVEDDVRNIFALSSVLEPKGAKVLIARNGREALELLDKTPNVDLVLMDIMRPEMGGIEATREIRKRPHFAKLPIIALTAKAMKDDQEKVRDAGASDYIAKPLDVEMLLSLLRVWMPK